jgi:glycogen operon protein
MILGGDECSQTQRGNNNAYCQDNPIGWLNWELSDVRKAFLGFVQQLIQVRRAQPVLRRRRFFQGRRLRGSEVKDLAWFEPSGEEMTDEDWNAQFVRCLGVRLAGDTIEEVDQRGERIMGDTLLVLLNAHDGQIPFTFPALQPGQEWELIVDTTASQVEPLRIQPGQPYPLEGRSLAIFRLKHNATQGSGFRVQGSG